MLLPAPLRPMIPTTSPCSTSSVTSSSARNVWRFTGAPPASRRNPLAAASLSDAAWPSRNSFVT